MSSTSDPGLARVLAAALTLFGRHGFQRTSMADIAREAGIARATLYLRFSEKRAVFKALAESLVNEALTRAEAAWTPDASLSENIAKTLLAKELTFFRMLTETPHGAELLELNAEMTAVHIVRLDEGFVALLARRGRETMERGADLTAFEGAEGFSAFLAAAGAGLKYQARTEAAFRTGIQRLARVCARAAGQV